MNEWQIIKVLCASMLMMKIDFAKIREKKVITKTMLNINGHFGN